MNEELFLAKRFGLPPEKRLRQQRDFERVFADSRHAADNVLVVLARRNGLAWSRIGPVISRKVGIAVVRNRWKRLIREAFRLAQDELPGGIDIVARPQKGAKPELVSIRKSLVALARRIAKRVAKRLPTPDPRAPIASERGESKKGERGASAP